MDTDPRVLTIADTLALGKIVDAAIRLAHVRWLDDNSGEVRGGTARHICADDTFGSFLLDGQDVRDGVLRITTDQGFELAMPMSRAVEMALTATLVVDA